LRDRSQALRVEALFDFGHQRGCTSRDLRQLIDAKMGEPTAEWTDGLKLRYAAACLEQNDRSNFDRYVNWALFSMEAMPPGPRRENLVRMVVRLALGGGQLSMSFDQWFLIDQLIARADSSSRQLVELPDPKLSQGGLSLREWLFALHIAKKDFGVDHANVLFDHLGPAMVARLQGRSGLGALVRAAVTKRPNR
jgi:hypothetical protein